MRAGFNNKFSAVYRPKRQLARRNTMSQVTEEKPEKDNFVLYVVLVTAVVVGAILAVKMSENEKFAPIKDQIAEEHRLMNIRVIANRED